MMRIWLDGSVDDGSDIGALVTGNPDFFGKRASVEFVCEADGMVSSRLFDGEVHRLADKPVTASDATAIKLRFARPISITEADVAVVGSARAGLECGGAKAEASLNPSRGGGATVRSCSACAPRQTVAARPK